MEKKCGRSERSKYIRERKKSRSKREEKSGVRRSEKIVRKVVWSRSEQSV